MNFRKAYLQRALEGMNFHELTEVQQKVIPLISQGKDMIVEAKTGSGKTHAYLLPIFDALDEKNHDLQAVICAPTKELARQIFVFAKEIASFADQPIDIRLYVGGTDKTGEIEQLAKSQPLIAIGTPGRLFDLVKQENALASRNARVFVVDEADMTLEEGFLFHVDQVAATMKKELQMLVFSATIPEKIRPFLRKYLHAPEMVRIHSAEAHSLQIKHYFIKTREVEKQTVLFNLLKTFQPYLCLIFCNTIVSCEQLHAEMLAANFNVVMVHGDIPYRKRKQLLDRIRHQDFQYVVATDILSRGIDIENISHIVNYELPRDPSFYIHRSGRTGRMSKDGICISLYEFADNTYIDQLEAMRINCEYKEIVGNELLEGKVRKEREKRYKKTTEPDKQAVKMIPKPKKVKPGYKVKRKQAVEKKAKELQYKGGRK